MIKEFSDSVLVVAILFTIGAFCMSLYCVLEIESLTQDIKVIRERGYDNHKIIKAMANKLNLRIVEIPETPARFMILGPKDGLTEMEKWDYFWYGRKP